MFQIIYAQLITLQQYDREGDIEDVVRFSDEDGEVEPENNSFDDSEAEDIDIQKENSGSDANHQCIDVSSDDEEQQKFLNVFKEVFTLFQT